MDGSDDLPPLDYERPDVREEERLRSMPEGYLGHQVDRSGVMGLGCGSWIAIVMITLILAFAMLVWLFSKVHF